MKLLKEIFDQLGFIDSEQLHELAEVFPNMELIIRWGGMPRERVHAWQAIERIEKVEAENIDYCREVFLSGRDCDNLRTALHISD